jgi:hypothetical protein
VVPGAVRGVVATLSFRPERPSMPAD